MGEIAESAVLSLLEPGPLRFTAAHERDVPRVRAAIQRAADGTLARLKPVNRKAFLLGCLDFIEHRPLEYLIVGFDFRHGVTTRVDGVRCAVGENNSVALPTDFAHGMWDYFQQCENCELLVFHNHPDNPINLLFDNKPLASSADRIFAATRGLSGRRLRD